MRCRALGLTGILAAAVIAAAVPSMPQEISAIGGVVPMAPGIPVRSYEEWKHAVMPPLGAVDPFFRISTSDPYGPRGMYGLWDHDEPLEVRTARVAAWWAALPPDFVIDTHPRYYTFLSPDRPPLLPSPTYESTYVGYEQRFLDEARAGGDVVIAFDVARQDGRVLVDLDGPRVAAFAVFAAGTPPERILQTLAYYFDRFGFYLVEAEKEAIIRDYAVSAGLPTDAAAMARYRAGDPRYAPFPTYEEWVHGMPFAARWFRGTTKWWHDDTLEERAGRSLMAWQGPEAYTLINAYTRFPGTFITLGNGDPYDAYEGRWIAEAIAAGDIVVPFVPPGDTPPGNVGARPLSFAVFWPGSPQDSLEMVLRTYLDVRYDMPPESIEAVIAGYRQMMGLDS